MKFNYKKFIIKKIFLYTLIIIFVFMLGHSITKLSYASQNQFYHNIKYNEKYNYPLFNINEYDIVINKYIDKLDKNIIKLNYKINYINNNLNILFIKRINNIDYYDSMLFSPNKQLISLREYINNDEYSFLYLINEEITKNNITLESNLKEENIDFLINEETVDLYIKDNDKVHHIVMNINTLKEIVNKPVDPIKYKYIAFTFDDGPSKYTLEIMDILDKYNYKATFFEVGYMIKNNPSIVKEVINRGYEVGNHTLDHSNLNKLNASKITQKIDGNSQLLKEYTGYEMKLVRCPYGNSNKLVRETINNPIVSWSVDSRDWESRNTEKIYNLVVNNTKEGDIILFHDIYKPTKDAIERLAEYFYKNNYQVVSVSKLFEIYNKNLENHTVYYNAR